MRTVTLALLAFLVVAVNASGYVLKHPAHERCKANYVRVKNGHKVLCKRPTSVEVGTVSLGGSGEPFFIVVSGFVWASSHTNSGPELRAVPIAYTLKDGTTGQTVGTITVPAKAHCSLVQSFNATGTATTYTGEAISGYPACNLAAPFTIPMRDSTEMTGAYAGNSTYAPSVSKPTTF